MASIRKPTQQSNYPLKQETPVSQRISKLSQKINNIHLPKQDNTKKYQLLDSICDDIQNQLEQFKKFAQQKLIDIRHKTNKISKQVQKDHTSIDNILRQQISNTNQRLMLILDEQHQSQKQSNLRILQFIDKQTNILKNTIQKQSIQRQQQGHSITQSLNTDIDHIIKILDQTTEQCKIKSQNLQYMLNQRTQRLSNNLLEICDTYSNNQAEFYKMLRDLVKKVKSQLDDHKIKREQTQTQILNLIDKMCDKTISQKNS